MDEKRLRKLARLDEAVQSNDLTELIADVRTVHKSMNVRDSKRVISEFIKKNARQAAVTEAFLHQLLAAMEGDLED